MKPSRVGWGAALSRGQFDLEDWQHSLKPPFDSWVVETAAGPILRSKTLEAASSADEAYEIAKSFLKLRNGAMAANQSALPIKLEYIVAFMSDGSVQRHPFIQCAQGRSASRGKVRAEAIRLGPDGKVIPPPPPEPSEVQHWIAITEKDDILADAVVHYSWGEDWFDIYKELECLNIRFGERKVEKWRPKEEVNRLSYTANAAAAILILDPFRHDLVQDVGATEAVPHGRLFYRTMIGPPDSGEEMPVGRVSRCSPIRRLAPPPQHRGDRNLVD